MNFFKHNWPFILLIVIALTIQTAFALFGSLNFTSDQAVMGIDATRVLDGVTPVYQAGQRYNGALFAYIAAPFLWVFGEQSVFALRIPYLMQYGVLLLVITVFTLRAFGRRIAILTLIFLSLPYYPILRWGFFLHWNLHALFTFSIFFLALCALKSRGDSLWRYTASIGFLSGIAYWHNPSFLAPVVVLSVITLLCSKLWTFFRKYSIPKNTVTYIHAFEAFVYGFLIGNAPQWIASVFLGIRAENMFAFGLPFMEHMEQFFGQILPLLLGLVHSPYEWTYWILILITLLFTGIFLFRYALLCVSVLRFPCIDRKFFPVILIAGTLMCHLVAVLCKEPANESYARFALIAWPCICILFAVSVDALVDRKRVIAYGITFLYVCVFSFSQFHYTKSVYLYTPAFNQFKPSSIHELEHALDDFGTETILADYWVAVALDYLLPERYTVGSFMGTNRYPQRFSAAMNATTFALMIRDWVPKTTVESSDDLESWFLQKARLRGPHRERIQEKVRLAHLREMKQVGRWYVLLYTEKIDNEIHIHNNHH